MDLSVIFLSLLLSIIEGIKLWQSRVKPYKRIHVFSPYHLLPVGIEVDTQQLNAPKLNVAY